MRCRAFFSAEGKTLSDAELLPGKTGADHLNYETPWQVFLIAVHGIVFCLESFGLP